jgi:DNA processing protein
MTAAAPERERLARAALNRVVEPGLVDVLDEVSRLGAERFFEDLLAGRTSFNDDLTVRMEAVDPAGDLERAAERGIRFVVPGDAEWPVPLDELGFTSPLQERGGVPIGLWVRGPRRLDEMVDCSVAVVGSRSASSYGSGVAADIAAGVAESGYTVVSGAAFGVDFHAHRGALAVDGPTVAVLACGPDRAYPAKHTALIEHIAHTGAVVSEGPLGGSAMRVRFLARNRLIAGLARGTVVVEAAVRSGALNTASWTNALGRTLMGVPGPVNSATSEGVHQLIRGRGALLVTKGAEVLEAVGPMGSFMLPEPRAAAHPRDLLSITDQQVLDAVPVAQPALTENVARTAGVHPRRTGQALDRLLAAGLVESVGGAWRALRDGEGPG